MEKVANTLLAKCCCGGESEKASDDDQVDVKNAVACCVRTQELYIDLCDDDNDGSRKKEAAQCRHDVEEPVLRVRKGQRAAKQPSIAAESPTPDG